MKDAATILSGLNFKEAMINGYRKEIRIEYDHTDLLLHFEERRATTSFTSASVMYDV